MLQKKSADGDYAQDMVHQQGVGPGRRGPLRHAGRASGTSRDVGAVPCRLALHLLALRLAQHPAMRATLEALMVRGAQAQARTYIAARRHRRTPSSDGSVPGRCGAVSRRHARGRHSCPYCGGPRNDSAARPSSASTHPTPTRPARRAGVLRDSRAAYRGQRRGRRRPAASGERRAAAAVAAALTAIGMDGMDVARLPAMMRSHCRVLRRAILFLIASAALLLPTACHGLHDVAWALEIAVHEHPRHHHHHGHGCYHHDHVHHPRHCRR